MDEAALEIVREWLARADHDLRSARWLASSKDPLLDTAIYHCQQAAEKSVKAWLQSIDDPFPKTHDIEDLVKRASVINPDFRKF
jgi:HEPN domain-containing protein